MDPRLDQQRQWPRGGAMTGPRLALALDTATETTVVSLGVHSDGFLTVWGSAEIEAPRAALSKVLLVAEDLLNENRMAISDVGEIVVGMGPGSFTGVRIGVAVAKGLAHGLGVPLYGVGTLDAVAWRFAGREGLLGVVGDAMRGEVYPALFRCSGHRAERLTPDRVAKPANAAEEWRAHAGQILLTGNGLAKHAEVFTDVLGEDALAPRELWSPTGVSLLAAFLAAAEEDRLGDGEPGTVLPVYTRLSDAEEAERTRSGVPSGPPPDSGVAGGAS